MLSCLKVKKHESNQTLFTKNGGVLLEELIAFCNGRSNPIRHFTEKELLIATKYYERSQLIVYGAEFDLYKGSLKDYLIFVKKYKNVPRCKFGNPYKDIVIGSQMSVHKNVLKVLGCCLETKIPTIVYEFAGTKKLSECISGTNVEPLPWKCRLEIAIDLANAISYLHTAFSRPVIHRDISSRRIILNQNNIPKLIDFGLCISIPEGKSHVEAAFKGRNGFFAPEYIATGYLSEKADIYDYGMLLLEILCGKKIGYFIIELDIDPAELFAKNFENLIDQRMTNEVIEVEQLQDFAALIIRCISHDEEKRPKMIEVAKELRQIYQSLTSPS